MNQNYKKINFIAGSTIESAVLELHSYRTQGILASGEFNGVKLFSDTVTMDEAYQKITGRTKAEFDESQQKWKQESEQREKDFKEKIPSLSEEWMTKGREVLSADKWDFWDEIVPIRLNDLYHGMELGCCLDIVRILNDDKSLDEAKREIEKQNHSGTSFGLVCSMVKEFSKRGKDFVDYIR